MKTPESKSMAVVVAKLARAAMDATGDACSASRALEEAVCLLDGDRDKWRDECETAYSRLASAANPVQRKAAR